MPRYRIRPIALEILRMPEDQLFKEYELIQEKKSDLSRSQIEIVVARVEAMKKQKEMKDGK